MGFTFKNLFTRKPVFSRAAARYSCQLDSVLVVIDRMISYEGRVIDMSRGGAMFRPRLAYLLDRRDVPILLKVGNLEIYGRIMSTGPSGFGLRFDDAVDEADILTLLEKNIVPVKAGAAEEAQFA
jgi:PilZ domain